MIWSSLFTTAIYLTVLDICRPFAECTPLSSGNSQPQLEERQRQERDTFHPSVFCRNRNRPDYTIISANFDGDVDSGQAGVFVQSLYGDGQKHWFMFYQNSWDARPYRAIQIPDGIPYFVDLGCPGWQGRLVRGLEADIDVQPSRFGTLAEFVWTPTGEWIGDVSIIEGCDGAMTIQPLGDPSRGAGRIVGWNYDILTAAPPAALVYKRGGSGPTILDRTDLREGNPIARTYAYNVVDSGPNGVYIIDDPPVHPVTAAKSGRVWVVFYPGVH